MASEWTLAPYQGPGKGDTLASVCRGMIGAVTDSEIDPDLIRVKAEFYALEASHAEYCASLPREPTEDQRGRLQAEQRALTEAAMRTHRHPAFEGLSQMQRYELDKAASKAARANM